MRAEGLLSPPACSSGRAASVSPSRGRSAAPAVSAATVTPPDLLPCLQRHTRGRQLPWSHRPAAAGTRAWRRWQDSQQRYPVPPNPTAVRRVLSVSPLLQGEPAMRDGHAAGSAVLPGKGTSRHAGWPVRHSHVCGVGPAGHSPEHPAAGGTVAVVSAGGGGEGGSGCRAELRECCTQALCLARVGGSQGVRSEC